MFLFLLFPFPKISFPQYVPMISYLCCIIASSDFLRNVLLFSSTSD